MADTCNEHGLLLEQLKHVTKSLDANTATSNRLIEKLERVATDNSRSAVELDHVKETVADLKADLKDLENEMKAADGDQWTAINALRAKVFTGAGLVLAGSVAISVGGALLAALIGK